MVFSSYVFLFLFLPLTCGIYFLLPRRCKNLWLLLVSLFFYSWNSPQYTLILFASIFINWVGGWVLGTGCRHRKLTLVLTLTANLLLLLYFKYANFIIDNISTIFPAIADGWQTVVLPLGISFFTFQGISYVVDVYRRQTSHLRNPLDVGLYISLFPQLVAGPIVRFSDVAHDIHHRTTKMEDVGYGFRRFVYGLAKKVILADTFGMMADYVFEATYEWGFFFNWMGIMAYSLQIFYDFSGYSDMAIGLGRIFGFRFGENFNYPYIAQSVTDFWRRWHISLTSWFRDYVYIPLGGNRVGALRHIRNIVVVWLLTGIWHGANWTFILWGAYFCVLLLVEKFIIFRYKLSVPYLRNVCTLLLVMIGWVLFRADNVGLATDYLQCLLSPTADVDDFYLAARRFINYKFFWAAGIIGIFPWMPWLKSKIRSERSRALMSAFDTLYLVLLFIVTVLFILSGNYNSFIYFQF